jgi:uncharacterized protein (TIGR03067 family)
MIISAMPDVLRQVYQWLKCRGEAYTLSPQPIQPPDMKTPPALHLTGIILVCLTATALPGADDVDLGQRTKFSGVWKGFTVEGRGENPDRGPVKLELTITEKTMKGLEFKGTNVVNHGEGEYVLDLGQDPKYLDAWKTNENGRKQSFLGIYSLEGDTLKWCVSPRKTRPTEFRTGDGGFLLILKRQKPAEPKTE